MSSRAPGPGQQAPGPQQGLDVTRGAVGWCGELPRLRGVGSGQQVASVLSRVSGSLTEKEIPTEAGAGAQERGCVWAGRARGSERSRQTLCGSNE